MSGLLTQSPTGEGRFCSIVTIERSSLHTIGVPCCASSFDRDRAEAYGRVVVLGRGHVPQLEHLLIPNVAMNVLGPEALP